MLKSQWLNRAGWPGLLVALLLALALAACGDPTATTAPATTRAATTAAATTAPATTAAATTTSSTTAATPAPATPAAATTPATTTAATTSAAAATTASATKAGATTYPLTVTDDAKRSLKFDKAPGKIVSLSPSNTELLFALGLGERVVGVDSFSNYPEEAKKIEKIGGFSETNLEKVVALSPDLVLASGITSKQLLSSMEARGLTVLIINPSNLAGVVANIKLLAQVVGVPDKGEQVAGDFQKKLNDVAARVKDAKAKPRVYYELSTDLFTVGPGSFVDDMLQKAGGQNIVTDAANPYPQLNQEAVISKDPEVILVPIYEGAQSAPDKVLTRPGWNNVSAIKNKRVYPVDADLVSRSGPRAALGVETVAKALYPDLFK